jgi:hypothetical protein
MSGAVSLLPHTLSKLVKEKNLFLRVFIPAVFRYIGKGKGCSNTANSVVSLVWLYQTHLDVIKALQVVASFHMFI